MMNKSTFITIMNEMDKFYNETWKSMEALGFNQDSNAITVGMDTILEAVDKEIDPKGLAKNDSYTKESGSFLFEWLFGETEFNNICATAENLWNYIGAAYAKKASEDYGKTVSGEPDEEV